MARGFADLGRLDATAQIQALATRRISALELLEASVANATLMAKDLNAVVSRDLDTAREKARAIDDRRAKGEAVESLGALAGLPMTVKDSIDVHGLPASSGKREYLGRKPPDAPAILRVRQAGAVIWGKTNTPVMAADWQTFNPVYGTTNNPWDTTRTPGGSSGGAAAAVASGISPLEVGSDIGGSLRIPASFCGIYSHKPTFGLVSTVGHVPPQPGAAAETDMNVLGPMARSTRDLRLLLSVMTESPLPARAPPANLSETRIGLWLDEPLFKLDPEVRRVIERFAADLQAQGAIIEPIKSPVDTETLVKTFTTLLMSLEGARDKSLRRRLGWSRPFAKLARAMGAATPMSWAAMVLALTARHAEWIAADEVRAQLAGVMRATFEKYAAVVAPVSPTAAFLHDQRQPLSRRVLRASDGARYPYDSMWSWIALASACGLPATTVPAGLTSEGLPVGVQIIGPRGADSKTLAVAQAFEEKLGGFVPPPQE